MVTVCIPGLMLRGGPGQSEVAPVCVAADYAAGPEDLDTSVTGDSVKTVSEIRSPFIIILNRRMTGERGRTAE